MYREKVFFPKKLLIVINLSFVALKYNNEGERWLENVVNICNELNIKYIISQHPNDKTDTSKYNVTNSTIYQAIKQSSLLISRFSTTILEALVIGKPAVYYKPHNETTKLYDNNYGAFSVVSSKEALKKAVLYELQHINNIRQRANKFLDMQCNINSKIEPSKLASNYIEEILNKKSSISS
jgi:CDP-glycerol glycerophosphotransferase (TagB/SpsB family)